MIPKLRAHQNQFNKKILLENFKYPYSINFLLHSHRTKLSKSIFGVETNERGLKIKKKSLINFYHYFFYIEYFTITNNSI